MKSDTLHVTRDKTGDKLQVTSDKLPTPLPVTCHLSPVTCRQGAVLLGALIILLTISLIGATLASFFFSVTTVAEVELARTQALYLAEAGIANAIHQIQQAGSLGGEAQQRIAPTQLGGGEYEVSHDLVAGLITATGKVRGVRRTIQLKYYPF